MTLVGCLAISAAYAEEKAPKLTKVTGDVKCAHCDFSVVSSCAKAVQTKKGKIFVLSGEKAKKFFADNKDVKRVKVEGVAAKAIGEDDKKHRVLDVKSIDEAKKKKTT